ncbi:hypothetical protein MES4922_90149 [Mesorhizobium ventifaucium]|uniref:Uncharacterized protein n=1 Tax=Mesorhizobium ventifaucium TaxID=666020 RepID=A0ABM9EFU4_9HYPH|nr:hypothetical protein MES4922_90149 [Mesorhizobium ventifaucium]
MKTVLLLCSSEASFLTNVRFWNGTTKAYAFWVSRSRFKFSWGGPAKADSGPRERQLRRSATNCSSWSDHAIERWVADQPNANICGMRHTNCHTNLQKSMAVVRYVVEKYGDPDRNRTCDLQIRNLPLYPTELRDHAARHIAASDRFAKSALHPINRVSSMGGSMAVERLLLTIRNCILVTHD